MVLHNPGNIILILLSFFKKKGFYVNKPIASFLPVLCWNRFYFNLIVVVKAGLEHIAGR